MRDSIGSRAAGYAAGMAQARKELAPTRFPPKNQLKYAAFSRIWRHMALIVQKFGGTSVGSAERIKHVARRVARWKAGGHDIVVVVSAMAGETNRLIALAKELQAQPDPRELDVMLATGEQVTIALLAMALLDHGIKARSYTGGQVRIVTDSAYTKARIKSIDDHSIRRDLADGYVAVVAGFQGVNDRGDITTLGRGGSDTTGVALAAALKADECQIYTDVDGVYTTDPRIVPEARRLKTITFEEMLEMASLGSKVLQIRSVEFAGRYRVKLRVLSSFEEESEGTLITFEEDQKMEQASISGIAFNRDEAKITILGVPDRPGIAYQILGPVGDANVDVDMIVQNVSHDGTTDFSFTVHRNELQKTLKILEPVVKHIKARGVESGDKIAKVSVVGVGMRSHAGIASTAFRTLAEEGINIEMISTSEIKISVVINEKYTELAVRVLHKAFGLEQPV
jgi:aspartate kinase